MKVRFGKVKATIIFLNHDYFLLFMVEQLGNRIVYFHVNANIDDRIAVQKEGLQPKWVTIHSSVMSDSKYRKDSKGIYRKDSKGVCLKDSKENPIKSLVMILNDQVEQTEFETFDMMDIKCLMDEYNVKRPEELAGKPIMAYFSGSQNIAVRT